MLETIIEQLLQDKSNGNEFALTPFNPRPNKKMKNLFQKFETLDKQEIYKSLIFNICHDDILDALNVVKYHKGEIDYFDATISFEEFDFIEKFCTEETKIKYKLFFFRDYAKYLLEGRISKLDDVIIDKLLIEDIDLYIKVAKRLKIPDAIIKIFASNKHKIYDWLNSSNSQYEDLIQLNQPNFVLQNMHGALDVTNETIKYILEFAIPHIELYKSIKKNIGLKTLASLSNTNIIKDHHFDLVDTLDDVVFILNEGGLNLQQMESFMTSIKLNFPHIYSQLNTLIHLKNNCNYK